MKIDKQIFSLVKTNGGVVVFAVLLILYCTFETMKLFTDEMVKYHPWQKIRYAYPVSEISVVLLGYTWHRYKTSRFHKIVFCVLFFLFFFIVCFFILRLNP